MRARRNADRLSRKIVASSFLRPPRRDVTVMSRCFWWRPPRLGGGLLELLLDALATFLGSWGARAHTNAHLQSICRLGSRGSRLGSAWARVREPGVGPLCVSVRPSRRLLFTLLCHYFTLLRLNLGGVTDSRTRFQGGCHRLYFTLLYFTLLYFT